jgi:RNA polymerase sigma-70 factor, ECF subfamily
MRVPALEPSLFDRCVAGQPEAWRQLHREYLSMVTSSLRHLGVPAYELDDARQEVFVQLFRYLGRFQQRAELRTWIYKLCISQAARGRRRRKLEAAWRWLRPGRVRATAAQGLDWPEAEVARRVRAALDALKPIFRTVFVLYELEGLPGEEIAAITGLPYSTVRRRLHQARLAFTAHIQAQESAP